MTSPSRAGAERKEEKLAKVLYANMNPNFVWEQASTHKMWLSQTDAIIKYFKEG